MGKEVIYKSYDCECAFVKEEESSLEVLKKKAKSGELEVRCKAHGKYMYPVRYKEDSEQ
ncbi:hypothetical protein OQJ62_15890 [Microbulbifer thermotolerans]|uniref:hypothetical protein n=1 Tax=Microbulbifer thermotolerans TaxID=252514 RepID=UPI0022488FBA|nr:hypothetical protein [Microbulbifer thermotolerans]MCX2796406.1 hypothetical protein [Microbulbifer thermotolerans]